MFTQLQSIIKTARVQSWYLDLALFMDVLENNVKHNWTSVLLNCTET